MLPLHSRRVAHHSAEIRVRWSREMFLALWTIICEILNMWYDTGRKFWKINALVAGPLKTSFVTKSWEYLYLQLQMKVIKTENLEEIRSNFPRPPFSVASVCRRVSQGRGKSSHLRSHQPLQNFSRMSRKILIFEKQSAGMSKHTISKNKVHTRHAVIHTSYRGCRLSVFRCERMRLRWGCPRLESYPQMWS